MPNLVTRPPDERSEIVPGLQQGSVPVLRSLPTLGFHTVVLCAGEWQFDGKDVRGLEIIRCPLRDAYDLTQRELNTAAVVAGRVSRRVIAGKTVLVTCAAGLNRSGLVTGLAMHDLWSMGHLAGWPRLQGQWGGRRVVRHIMERRPGALSNEFFANIIEMWQPNAAAIGACQV